MAKKVTGTRIRFWPDPQVFVRDSRWSFDALRQRARQTAYLVPGLEILIRDERPPGDDIPANPPWRVICLNTGSTKAADAIDFVDFVAKQPAGLPAAKLGGNAPIIQIYTSGTTGRPKGVVAPIKALASFQIYAELGQGVERLGRLFVDREGAARPPLVVQLALDAHPGGHALAERDGLRPGAQQGEVTGGELIARDGQDQVEKSPLFDLAQGRRRSKSAGFPVPNQVGGDKGISAGFAHISARWEGIRGSLSRNGVLRQGVPWR